MAGKTMTRTTKSIVDTVPDKEVEETVSAKVYKSDDLIPCKSITNGQLLVEGNKTHFLYRWADYGDVENIEYQDLIYMVRSRDGILMKPRFLIMDDDFVEQNSSLKDLYESMYSTRDLKDILKMQNKDAMIKTIDSLPEGAKDAIQGIVATMIDRGEFDSVAKIKAIDEYFDTKLLLTLAQS